MTIGSTIWRTQETSDSMAWARENCFDAPDGTLFIPDVYKAAQGRNNRVWQLAEGQLTKTLILKPLLKNNQQALMLSALMMALSLGILEPLKQFKVALKWPNDFMLNNKKLGGIRTEVVWLSNKPYAITVGYSLNINNIFTLDNPLKQKSISLYESTHALHDIASLDAAIIQSLNVFYKAWQNEKYEDIITSWKKTQLYQGEQLSIHKLDGTLITGIVEGFTDDGNLIFLVENKPQIIPLFIVSEINSL